MKRAILTGFEPFGPYAFNPTQDIAREFHGRRVDGVEVRGFVLPCTYYGAFELLHEEMQRLSPDIVLSTGLASRVLALRIETVGKNIMHSKYPDAEGRHSCGEPLLFHGKPRYRTNTDGIALVNFLSDLGIPADVSEDAEGFVCNSLIYLTAKEIHEESLPIAHAFFHTPWTDAYTDKVQLEEGKIVIPQYRLRKTVEGLLGFLSLDKYTRKL